MDNGVFAEALDCRKRVEAIFSRLGGKDNIIRAAHCATRLCLVIADNRKIDTKALEEMKLNDIFNIQQHQNCGY